MRGQGEISRAVRHDGDTLPFVGESVWNQGGGIYPRRLGVGDNIHHDSVKDVEEAKVDSRSGNG